MTYAREAMAEARAFNAQVDALSEAMERVSDIDRQIIEAHRGAANVFDELLAGLDAIIAGEAPGKAVL